MKTAYGRVWFASACAIAIPGVVVGLVGSAVWVNVAAGLTVGVGVAAIAVSADQTGSRGPGCRAVVVGGVGAAISFAVSGLCSMFGPDALLVALLWAVTSPSALGGLRSLVRPPSRPSSSAGPVQLPDTPRATSEHNTAVAHSGPELTRTPEPPDVLDRERSLSDDEVLRAWDHSADLLDSLRSGDHRDELLRQIALRQRYLDELERRHPETLAGWLAAGAPASRWPADARILDDPSDDQQRRDTR